MSPTSKVGWGAGRARGRRLRRRSLASLAPATLAVGALAVAPLACAPRARPLLGAPAPATARLPRVELPAGSQRVVFRWRYQEDGFSARGDGAARVAPPDSARLDFFLEGGYGGGWAILLGDAVSTPPGSVGQRLIPPAPMLWATLGRLALGSARDTTIRTSGDTLRADVAATDGRVWRATLAGGRLVSLEHLLRGRVVERLTRDSAAVRYTDVVGRRSLVIDVQRREPTNAFPTSTWSR